MGFFQAYVLDYWVRHLLMPVFIVMNLVRPTHTQSPTTRWPNSLRMVAQAFFVYAQMEVASLHEWIQLLRTQAGQQ